MMNTDEEILRRIADRAYADVDLVEWVAWHTSIPYPPRFYPLTEISWDRRSDDDPQSGDTEPPVARTPRSEP